MAATARKDKNLLMSADSILPPSKPSMGNRLRLPKAKEDMIKRDVGERKYAAIPADRKLKKGPPIHKSISSV